MVTVATLDAETDPFLHDRIPKPFVWGLYEGKSDTYWEFDETQDVVAFLRDKKWVVYAHNGGKFDYHLDGFLDELKAFQKLRLINGRLSEFKIGECTFRDSWNILPVPLKKLGAKGSIDYALLEADVRNQHMAEIRKYLKQDCVVLWDAVDAFRKEYGPGLTVAGAAMKYWQELAHRDAPQTPASWYESLSCFYYGGRVEAFHSGEFHGDFQVADINSAYPYAMLSEHPIGDSMQVTGFKGIVPQDFYHVTAPAIGCFPRREESGGLAFPDDGEPAEFFITGWELQEAIKWGLQFECHKQIHIPITVNFSSYVDHFYRAKKRAAKGSHGYTFAKLMMNSLYGKFGSNPDRYRNFEVLEQGDAEAARTAGYTVAGELGPWLIGASPLEPHEARFYNVATAASITGFVRAYMTRHIMSARAAGGAVLYCDTDSLAVAGVDPSTVMQIGDELGEWDVEAVCDYGAICGKKTYAFRTIDGEWKHGCKGVRLGPEEIVEIAQGRTVEWKNDAPSFSMSGKTKFISRKVRNTA